MDPSLQSWAGAGGFAELAVAEDMAGLKCIFLPEPGEELFETCQLSLRRQFFREVPQEGYAEIAGIVLVDMRPQGAFGATFIDLAIAADKEVIADASPLAGVAVVVFDRTEEVDVAEFHQCRLLVSVVNTENPDLP